MIVDETRRYHSLTNGDTTPVAAVAALSGSQLLGTRLRRRLSKLATKWVRHKPFRKDMSITRLSVKGTVAEDTVRT